MNTTFSIKSLFRNAWEDYKKYWGVILLIALTFCIAQAIGMTGMEYNPEYGTFINNSFASMISWFAVTWLSVGYLNFLLNIVDGKQARYRDIFYGVKSAEQFAYYVLVTIVYTVIVGLGTLLLIIPGIIFAIGLVFAKYYIAENRLGFKNAFNSSWEITKGNRWKIFGFAVVAVFFNLLGLIALGIGLLITFPMTQLMYARMFRNLEGIPVPSGGAQTDEEPTVIYEEKVTVEVTEEPAEE